MASPHLGIGAVHGVRHRTVASEPYVEGGTAPWHRIRTLRAAPHRVPEFGAIRSGKGLAALMASPHQVRFRVTA